MFKERLAWNICSTPISARNFCIRNVQNETTAKLVTKLWISRTENCLCTRRMSHERSYFTRPLWKTKPLNQESPQHSHTRGSDSCNKKTNPSTATCVSNTQTSTSLSEKRLWLPTERQTYKLGRMLGRDCRAGDAILLFGDLGVGKTALARGYIHSAHSDNSLAITSPSYLLLNSYPTPPGQAHLGIPDILHMDLWRLNDASQRPIVDFKNAFIQAACLIEWPDRLKSITPLTRLEVHMSYVNNEHDVATSEDDPWGFEIDDPDGSLQQCGRYVSLKPHGKEWYERVKTLLRDFTCLDPANRLTLVND